MYITIVLVNIIIRTSLTIAVSLVMGFGLLFSDSLTREEKQELVLHARQMGGIGIPYAGSWKPPGMSENWTMDCSNTVRYTYQKVFDKELPRISYDQYIAAKKSGVFHKAPVTPNGSVDTEALRKALRMGDVLFWENTYNVDRDPPVSHVMVYLGKNKANNMKMFGAGTFGKGEQTNSGGVDVYPFDPNAKLGCSKDAAGKCVKNSRFIGFARFL